jgi:hypothetical protein
MYVLKELNFLFDSNQISFVSDTKNHSFSISAAAKRDRAIKQTELYLNYLYLVRDNLDKLIPSASTKCEFNTLN